MLSKLGKSKNKTSNDALDAPLASNDSHSWRSTTPTPGNVHGDDQPLQTGMLSIRVIAARGLTLPTGVPVPNAVQKALGSNAGAAAASVSPSSVHQERLAKKHEKHPSLHRKNAWFMPYLVLEYEVNQVLVDSLGGKDLYNPVYMYQAQL